jgi:HEAT repeat protein
MENLLAALGDEDVSVRVEAVSQFATVDGPKDPLFKKVMEDSNHEVREAAGNLVALCPSLFEQFLADPDPAVRIAAINNSIGVRDALGDPRAVLTILNSAAADPSADVRRAIAKILPQHADVRQGGS